MMCWKTTTAARQVDRKYADGVADELQDGRGSARSAVRAPEWPTPDLQALVAVSEKRRVLLEKLEEFAVGNGTNAAEGHNRQEMPRQVDRKYADGVADELQDGRGSARSAVAVSEKRRVLLEKLEEFAVGNGTNAAEGVKRVVSWSSVSVEPA
jgi:hypothetical protein